MCRRGRLCGRNVERLGRAKRIGDDAAYANRAVRLESEVGSEEIRLERHIEKRSWFCDNHWKLRLCGTVAVHPAADGLLRDMKAQ